MALTRPAGCFLQLLATPVALAGIALLSSGPGGAVIGVALLGAGGAMLYFGGRPAREAATARQKAAQD